MQNSITAKTEDLLDRDYRHQRLLPIVKATPNKYCCQLLLHQRFRRTIVATNKRHNDFDEHLLLPTSSSNLCCRPSESLELQNSMIQQDALCNYKVHSWKCSAITLLDFRIQFICDGAGSVSTHVFGHRAKI